MGINNRSESKNLPGVTLGFNIAVSMAVFTFIGNWIDQKSGGGHFWTLVGMFVGLFYCGYETWKLARQNNNGVTSAKKDKCGRKI